jgi:membrane-associated phospholipid phosphatase
VLRLGRLTLASLLLLAAAAAAEAALYPSIHSADSRLLQRLGGTLDPGAARLVSLTASTWAVAAYWLLTAALAVVRGSERLRGEAAGLAIALLASMIVVLALKAALHTPRPSPRPPPARGAASLLLAADSYSYPSGHTARAAGLAAYYTVKRRAGLAALLWLWTLAVALSRLALNAHWPSDVAASILVGLFSASLAADLERGACNLLERITRRSRLEPQV